MDNENETITENLNAQNSEKNDDQTVSENGNKIKIILDKLSIKQKIFFASILLIIALCICVLAVVSKYPKKSRTFLYFENSSLPKENLSALNDKAVTGKLLKKEYAFYRFTDGQQKELASFYRRENQAGLRLGLSIKNISYEKLIETSSSEKPLFFGFLYRNDFNEKGKFSGEITGRILGSADLRNFVKTDGENGKSYLDVSIAMEKSLDESQIPCGFLVYTSLPVNILGALIESAKIGYDISGKVPLWALPSNGGKIGDMNTIDFTGATNVFSTANSSVSIMPVVKIQIKENPDFEGTSNSNRINLNAGGEVLTFFNFKDKVDFTLQTSMLSKPFSNYSINEKNLVFTKILMCANDKTLIPEEKNRVLEPLTTDPGLLPKSKPNTWRTNDYELYKWDEKENILLFDTKNYDIQSQFFTRLAFFVEKAGYKGRILTDSELENMHGYNAHDYRSESLAEFFNQAEKMPGVLNEKEMLLKDILLHNQIISFDGTKFIANKGALISISQESADYLRLSLCAHEIWHGLYFTDEDFRNATAAIYYTIDTNAIDFLKAYWTSNPSLGYDTNDIYLMQNEFMAYIMQNKAENVAKYFTHIANFNSSKRDLPVQAEYVIRTKARAFEDAAAAFDSYVLDRWGLECGRVALVVR